MECVAANDLMVHWAADHGYPCYRTAATVSGERRDALMMVLHRVTAYFEDGSLMRIAYPDDAKLWAEASREMALVFALCGCVSLLVDTPGRRHSGARRATRSLQAHPHTLGGRQP